MIARLAGTVAAIEGDTLVVDVHGVGYAVAVPTRLAAAARVDIAVVLWVHTAVREDAITLYGFALPADRAAFELLIGVTGVGPRIALSALSAMAVADLARAIEGNDLRALTAISGIGRKTAERLVLELRGKLAWTPGGTDPGPRPTAVDDPLALALAQLGYKKSEIDLAVARLADAGLGAAPLAERVAAALRGFAAGPRAV